MNRRKPRALPMLLGLPSPSLAKMNRMNTVELVEQIKRLASEEEALNAKIAKLEAHRPKPEEKIKMLKESVARLKVLTQLANTRMTEKQSRAAAMNTGGPGLDSGPRQQSYQPRDQREPQQPPLSSGYRRASYPPPANPGLGGPNSLQPRGPLGPGGPRGPLGPRQGPARPYQSRPTGGPLGPGPGGNRGPLGPGGPRQSPPNPGNFNPGNTNPGNTRFPNDPNNPGNTRYPNDPNNPGNSGPRRNP